MVGRDGCLRGEHEEKGRLWICSLDLSSFFPDVDDEILERNSYYAILGGFSSCCSSFFTHLHTHTTYIIAVVVVMFFFSSFFHRSGWCDWLPCYSLCASNGRPSRSGRTERRRRWGGLHTSSPGGGDPGGGRPPAREEGRGAPPPGTSPLTFFLQKDIFHQVNRKGLRGPCQPERSVRETTGGEGGGN